MRWVELHVLRQQTCSSIPGGCDVDGISRCLFHCTRCIQRVLRHHTMHLQAKPVVWPLPSTHHVSAPTCLCQAKGSSTAKMKSNIGPEPAGALG
jgi:hypothetical protein